jgi:hypothetical protein
VADLFAHPPAEAEWRPVLAGVSRLAFATLPASIRRDYGVSLSPARWAAVKATFAALRRFRPLLPPRYRFIAPYQEWLLRSKGLDPDGVARARRSVGIRL